MIVAMCDCQARLDRVALADTSTAYGRLCAALLEIAAQRRAGRYICLATFSRAPTTKYIVVMTSVRELHRFVRRLPEELRDLVIAFVIAVYDIVRIVPPLPTTAASRLAFVQCGANELVDIVARVNGAAPRTRVLTVAESASIVDAAGRRRAHAGISAPRHACHVDFREKVKGSRGDIFGGDVMRHLGLDSLIVVGTTPKRSRAGLHDGRRRHGGIELVRVHCSGPKYDVRRSLQCSNLANEIIEALRLPDAAVVRSCDGMSAHRNNLVHIAAFVAPSKSPVLNKLQRLCAASDTQCPIQDWIQRRVATAACNNVPLVDVPWALKADVDLRRLALDYARVDCILEQMLDPSAHEPDLVKQMYDDSASLWRTMYAVATLCSLPDLSPAELRAQHHAFADSLFI